MLEENKVLKESTIFSLLVISFSFEIERTLELPKGKISYYDHQTPKYYEEINQKH